MHMVLSTFLAMASGTVHNVGSLVPSLPNPAAYASTTSGPPSYAYDEDHCTTRRSGAIVCRRRPR